MQSTTRCREFQSFSYWLVGLVTILGVVIVLIGYMAPMLYQWPDVIIIFLVVSLSVTWFVYSVRKNYLISRDNVLLLIKSKITELRIEALTNGVPITDEDILSAFDPTCRDYVKFVLGSLKTNE